jgi:polygalacturonase
MNKIFATSLVAAFACLCASAKGTETLKWQSAIDAAHAAGGGRVTIPAGDHKVGSLSLKSNVELHLSKSSRLIAVADKDLFKPAVEIKYVEGNPCAIIVAICATNVAVTGEGEIFGNAPQFDSFTKGTQKPMGLCFYKCSDVKLEDFYLHDAAAWGINFIRSENIVARRIRINNHAGECTDGFDIEAKNVLIEDCDVDAGDDAYCLKSNDPDYAVENITIRRCIARTHCNAYKLGTASHGIMRNISFVDCKAAPARRVYRDLGPMPKDLLNWQPVPGAPWYLCGPGFGAVNVECVDGGLVENVVADNIEVEGYQTPLFIRAGDRKNREYAPQGNKFVVRNIVFSNIRGRADGRTVSTITGTDKCRPYNIVLKNINIEVPGEGESDKPFSWPGEESAGAYPQTNMFDAYRLPAYGLFIDKADGVKLENVNFTLRKGTSDKRPPVFKTDKCDCK